jgi:hypothetical protein
MCISTSVGKMQFNRGYVKFIVFPVVMIIISNRLLNNNVMFAVWRGGGVCFKYQNSNQVEEITGINYYRC